MSHHLSLFTNQEGATQAEMAYAGGAPWHHLGQQVKPGASIEQWLDQAHMNWGYDEHPVQFTNGQLRDYPDYKVISRNDTHQGLSVVSNRYKIVQPREIVEFFRDLVATHGFEIETLGSLKEGRRIWALAKTNIEQDVLAGDGLKAYLLLITSCDGSLATTAKFTSVRVVCWNTQDIALHHDVGGNVVKVRHNTVFDPSQVKENLGLVAQDSFDGFVSRMKNLSSLKLSSNDAGLVLASILPKPAGELNLVENTKGYRTIMSLFNGSGKGATLPGVQGTAWGLLNAVTEYVDHHVRARQVDNRVESAWFGAGNALKQKAELALSEML